MSDAPHHPHHPHHPHPQPEPHAHPQQHAGPDHRHDRGQSAPVDPYPFIYSRDLLDERRYAAPGQPYAPARNRLPRGTVLAAWAIVIVLVGGGLIAVITQIMGK